jgi:hypothetical protein
MENPLVEESPYSPRILSSDAMLDADEERRFVWFQNEVERQKMEDLKSAKHLDENVEEASDFNIPAFDKKKDFKNKFRCGGSKGKTGSTDFTRGKNAFVRPCTVGWKSQNQPLMKGGGNRTPRQKG